MDHPTRASSSPASSTGVVDVLVPVALDRAYSYRVPRGLELKAGDVVCVPLGPREVVGVVWAENAKPGLRVRVELPLDRLSTQIKRSATAIHAAIGRDDGEAPEGAYELGPGITNG